MTLCRKKSEKKGRERIENRGGERKDIRERNIRKKGLGENGSEEGRA